MVANKTYSFMVRCKCPGKLGTTRVEVNYTENRAGYDFFTYVQNHCGSCWSCQRRFRIEMIDGRRSEHVCGAKCTSSKGPSCECSCGGKNHGMAWAA